jgi:hypothetical protein
MGKVQEIDKELAEGLKQAKAKRMYFAVVLKGAADGALMVSKKKIPPTAIAEAKKNCGGSTVISGACFGEDGKHVFEVAKEPPATLAMALKTIARRDSGLTISPVCRVGSGPEMDEEGSGTETADAPVGTTKPGSTTTPTTPTTGQTGQKGALAPLPETAKFEAALKTWEQASAAALSATDKLLSALSSSTDEVAQAIASIIEGMRNDFPDTLDDALGNLAKAAKAGKAIDAEQFRTQAEIAIKASLAYLNNNAKTIDGCEQNPFGVSVAIRAPLTEALKQVLIGVKK